MRFKVSIDFVQTVDPGDFYKLAGGKKPMPVIAEFIEEHLKSSIEVAIQDAVDGHGYTLVDLQESLKFASEDELVKINVKYLDNQWGNDYIDIKEIF